MTSTEFQVWLDSAPKDRRTLVMGVMNLTPDSFSDGGRLLDVGSAFSRAREMVQQGVDLIDFGGESTRPGSQPVPAAEQIRRVIPTLRRVCKELDVTCSIDTTRAEVAKEALDVGAKIVNDVSAGLDDPLMFAQVARTGAAMVLMHMQGTPATMQQAPVYQDVVHDVIEFLKFRTDAALDAGVDRSRILLDPGIGFGKSVEHNLDLLARQKELLVLGRPLLIGTSRKGFIGHITSEPDPARRTYGTAATVAWAVANGAGVVRVHDVGEMRQVVQMTAALVGRTRWSV